MGHAHVQGIIRLLRCAQHVYYFLITICCRKSGHTFRAVHHHIGPLGMGHEIMRTSVALSCEFFRYVRGCGATAAELI